MTADAPPDPATPENRKALARRLLEGAIRRYEEACEEWTAVHESYPKLDPPRQPSGPEEVEERRYWVSLLHNADENFNAAELTLAERIHSLFWMLDPRRAVYAERGARLLRPPRSEARGQRLRARALSAYEYEPRQNVIAVYRDSLVIGLAEGHDTL